MTRLALTSLVLLLAAAFTAAARADKLPVLGVDVGTSGVTASPTSAVRYVTVPVGRRTLIAAVETNGGRVTRSRLIDGLFTIPVVAYDGSAAGISADGSTLVLVRPRARFPQPETTFAVVGAKRLHEREVITLRGDFSVDAISPDGTLLYLVQYLSPRDPTRYLVRLYDLGAGRLLPEPIIDPREVGDVMRGMPITRAASPDGRFAYTLYDGAGEHPFIHALDTVARTARCIDLHGLTSFELLNELRLDVSPDGGTLRVVHESLESPLALVDTRTSRVSEPVAPAEPPARPSEPADEDESPPWLLIGAAATLALLALVGLQRALKRRLARRPAKPPEVLGRVRDEVEVELRDPLLDDAPHGLAEVGHETHEAKGAKVLVP